MLFTVLRRFACPDRLRLPRASVARLLAVLLFLTVLPARAADLSLVEVRALAAGGATQLALHVMDRSQPDPGADPDTWMEWERERIAMYAANADWQALAQRVSEHPASLPPAFSRWAGTQQAEAYLRAGDSGAARHVLRGLLWGATDAEREWMIRWRRLVIRSYLADRLIADADTALQRFQQDYGSRGTEDLLLRARVLLLQERAGEAMRLLAPHAGDKQAAVMYVLAQLRSGARPAKEILQTALRQARTEQGAHYWPVVAEAAQRAEDPPTRANALEQSLVRQAADPGLAEGILDISGESLWAAYQDYALALGNEARYLVGDDKPWFALAAEAGAKFPVKTRSLLAFLMQRSHSEANRERAAVLFVESLKDAEQARILLPALFLDNAHFPTPAAIPEPIRHALVDQALAASDLALASRLMATMQAAPRGADRFMWQLRRARILVMGGQSAESAQALEALMKAEALNPEQLDRVLQVVFDLQTAGAHEEAVGLFGAVLTRSKDPKLQREMYYWMADSRKAQGNHQEAARLYLLSANLQGFERMDPWGQTAQYQAAESLAKAGLIGDARAMYQRLLRVTEDPARQAVLRQELQRLWLLQ